MASEQSTPDSTSSVRQATSMHRSISADRWCVTHRDLKFLRQEVWYAIQEGMIQPEDGKDDFDASDHVYGPSIYSVNEQYIKPVTREAGMMSWALMRHPQGLSCDVFISHAWQEGVFEFLRKVKHSWPRGVQNAWCCMLANPQNLDIGALLQNPCDSPFALALRASKMVLVVPNRHQSVYTRLWCGYEAFLAEEEGKTIVVAKDSKLQDIRSALQRMLMGALAGVALGFWAKHLGFRWPTQMSWIAAAATVVVLCIQNNKVRILLNIFGIMACCIKLTSPERVLWYDVWFVPKDWVLKVVCPFFWATSAIFFCLMEVDRVSGRSTGSEAQQLQQGYEGSIQYAQCAKQSDATKIRQEIDDQQDAVDFAIHVLLTAGMSTPALRYIAEAGVDIEFAAYSEITAAVILLIPLHCLTVANFAFHIMHFQGGWAVVILQGLSIVGRFILMVLIYRSPTDELCFQLKLLTKFAAFLLLAVGVSLLAIWLPTTRPLFIWLLMFDMGVLFMIPIAMLGIQGTAKRLPFGLCLLQLVFARGAKAFPACSCLCCGPREKFRQSSDSESSSE